MMYTRGWRFVLGVVGALLVASLALTGCGRDQSKDTVVAVADGVAFYVSVDGKLYAVDAKSGTQKWKYTEKGRVNSAPTVSNGVVYFGTSDGKLHALDVRSGTEKWNFKTKKERVRKKPSRVTTASAGKQTVGQKAKVEFFVMSKCPFGTQVENGIAPVLAKMGGDIDFSLDFIGGFAGGKLTSLHKEPEVLGNKAQICAAKYAPNNYMDMILCMNKTWRKIPDNWEECAKQTGMPVDQIRKCYEGQESHELMTASFKKSKAKKATGSPTLYIGGKLYRGGRTEKAFTRAVCDAFAKDKPALCDSVPAPAKVAVTIISDARCKDCRTAMIKQQMEGFFPGAELKMLDYTKDEQARTLCKELEITKLPVVLFDEAVKQAENYNRLQRSIKPKGDYLAFTRYAKFDPSKEICDNQKDDTGNGKVDCKDQDCKFALECRPDAKNKLEVFVMSQCPYGVRALDAMKEVLDNFKNNIEFQIHFIANEEGDGFKALHGQPEVDENIRELCAITHYPKNRKYMDYILCRNKSIRSKDWESCTGGKTGISTKVIKACFEGPEGKQLLRKDIKIAEGLGVSGSPTWFANNKFRFSGLDPEGIKNNLCRHNKGLKGCENKLTGPAKGKRPAGGACK